MSLRVGEEGPRWGLAGKLAPWVLCRLGAPAARGDEDADKPTRGRRAPRLRAALAVTAALVRSRSLCPHAAPGGQGPARGQDRTCKLG